MENISPPGPQHEHFIEWAKGKGIQINGVKPAKIPGRGLGIIAMRSINAGEELVNVPASALLSVKSIPKDFRLAQEGIGVHGLLASFLAFGGRETSPYSLWRETWPSPRDLKDSMPLLWPQISRSLKGFLSKADSFPDLVWRLPPAMGGRWSFDRSSSQPCNKLGLLHRQALKLQADWAIVSKVFPCQTLERYTYHWLLVNTRSFYYKLPEASYSQAREDCMVLCPFIDYFNHSDQGCIVAFDSNGYRVMSDKSYEAGEELFVSYGNHGNDFLLVEYGFVLEQNKWDSVPVDDLVLHASVSEPTKKRLKDAGYLGNYILSRDGLCHRTHVAIRAALLPVPEWENFVAGNVETTDEVVNARRANSYIVAHIMGPCYREAQRALAFLETAAETSPGLLPKPVLVRRWMQIRDLVVLAHGNSVDPNAGVGWAALSERLN